MTVSITKRDFKFFILGMVAAFLIFLIFEWEDAKTGFQDGWNAYEADKTESIK